MDLQCASFKGQNWSGKTMAGQSKLSNSLRKSPPPMDDQVGGRRCRLENVFICILPRALVTICTFELLLLTAHHPLPPPTLLLRSRVEASSFKRGRGAGLTRLGFEGEAGFDWADWKTFTFPSLLLSSLPYPPPSLSHSRSPLLRSFR